MRTIYATFGNLQLDNSGPEVRLYREPVEKRPGVPDDEILPRWPGSENANFALILSPRLFRSIFGALPEAAEDGPKPPWGSARSAGAS